MEHNPVSGICCKNAVFQKIVLLAQMISSLNTIQFLKKSSPDGKQILYAWFEAMHTRADLLLYAGMPFDRLEFIARTIQDEINRIAKIVNRFDPESELSYLNKNAFAHPCPVSGELAEMIGECLYFHKKTLGCFDITVHSLNGFRSGANAIVLDNEEKTIAFQHPAVQIDLNGYVKGYALRSIAKILKENDIQDSLINLGNSSVLAIGNHPNGKGWSVGIDPQYKKGDTAIALFNECLTTSGNYLKQQHIINPETGKLIEKQDIVSVVTSDPALGEILSTAFFVANDFQRQQMLKHFTPRPPEGGGKKKSPSGDLGVKRLIMTETM